MAESRTSLLPTEVELALEVMPCQALRRSYDSAPQPHACSYFAEWGYYHSYDYGDAGPPESGSTVLPVVYAGKHQVVPELLSGCRKAPILCVGINPNLPGWSDGTRNAIHPYFDSFLQYVHYFRYRTRDKLRIPSKQYDQLLGTGTDVPSSAKPLASLNQSIPVERSPVLMYQQYQTLLDGLATRQHWNDHKLSVGEDIAYANMVACPSARWVVSRSDEDPAMPVMGTARAQGIVNECFSKRRYFLRQLFQTLPAVILVFSKTTAAEFIPAMQGRFTAGDPKVDESLEALFAREVRLKFGTLADGTVLDARVIFLPHASARAQDFARVREPTIGYLIQEVAAGRLVYDAKSGHLRRGRGGCVFCTNSLYRIGPCDYESELRPIAPMKLVKAKKAGPPDPLREKDEQARLLKDFLDRKA